MEDKLIIRGARENNLKNINIDIPKNKLVIMTGLSGSGKTSLAFDTIYAEGQRRYVESLSAYARQFLGNMEKPDVDAIEGLSPAVAIDQKTTSNNPRSTVGTVTEIYDYLRLLYARVGKAYCPKHDVVIESQTIKQMADTIDQYADGDRLMVVARVVKRKKGTFKDYFADLLKDGYLRVVVDGQNYMLDEEIELDKNKKHDIDVVIDRIIKKEGYRSRLVDSLEVGLKLTGGEVIVQNLTTKTEELFSEHLACPICGFSVPKLEPRLFSFNNPLGACPDCRGLGIKNEVDDDLLIPDWSKSINKNFLQRTMRVKLYNLMHFHHCTECEKFQNVPASWLLLPALAVSARLLPMCPLTLSMPLILHPMLKQIYCSHTQFLLLHLEFLQSYYHNHTIHTPNVSKVSGHHLLCEMLTYH